MFNKNDMLFKQSSCFGWFSHRGQDNCTSLGLLECYHVTTSLFHLQGHECTCPYGLNAIICM